MREHLASCFEVGVLKPFLQVYAKPKVKFFALAVFLCTVQVENQTVVHSWSNAQFAMNGFIYSALDEEKIFQTMTGFVLLARRQGGQSQFSFSKAISPFSIYMYTHGHSCTCVL